MYLVYGFVPQRDSFEDENFQSKVLLKFQVKSEDANENAKIFDYYEEDGVYALSTVLNIADSEGNVHEANIPTAWKNGTFYVNLLNAGAYEYDVTCISEVYAAPVVEELQKGGAVNQSVFTSSTFVAFACAAVLISVILCIFYKLGALSISVTSLATIFFGILFLMIFGTEFNVLAVVGLIIVGFASIASGCVYLNKFKDEAYRGRSVKKANTEASKKSNLVIADIHFALIVLGAFSYLIGGVGMKSFALVTVLAGLVSLILNLTVFKGFMWLDDVGLVGFPSVGKSTLLSVVSAAKPEIADYPFTTIVPNLGLVSAKDGRSFVMADLPGLIEGAHLGKGLGLTFLRHIERCRVIVHVIDFSETGRDPYEDYKAILNELDCYGFGLNKRPSILVASKMDEEGAEERLKEFKKKVDQEIIPISAITEENIDQVIYKCADLIEKTPLFPLYSEETI